MTSVFVIDLDDGQLSDPNLLSWLAAAERARMNRFATGQLAQRFAVARLATRIILGRATGRRPSTLHFKTNAWGRPELPGGPHFNLTHAGDLALLAVDEDAAVGIDMEMKSEVVDEATLSEFLSPEEHASRPSAERCLATRLWVRKEALLKADGRGLSLDTKTVTVGWHRFDTENWRTVAVGERHEPHGLIDVDAGKRSIAALARFGIDHGDVSIVPFRFEHR
jgi:4'-phosphopantetheinyl transferase